MIEDAKRRKVSLTTLHAVTEVLKSRSITRAASKLNISQPAMSAHLKRFEETLGFSPIRRVGNEMLITSNESIGIINQILALEKKLFDIGKSFNSRMPRLGICSYLGLCLVDGFDGASFLVSRFSIHFNCSSLISDMFSCGDLDLIVRPVLIDEQPDFSHSLPIVWCGNVSHNSLIRKEPVRVILGPGNSPIGILARNWLEKNNIPFLVVMESEDPNIIWRMCKTLDAATPVPRHLVDKFDFAISNILANYDPFEVSIGVFLTDRNISYLEAERYFNRIIHTIYPDSMERLIGCAHPKSKLQTY